MLSQLPNSLKQFTSPQLLALAKQGLEYVLDTDATESKLSACLQHQNEYCVMPLIGYWPRKISRM
jgi:hypothetical protein